MAAPSTYTRKVQGTVLTIKRGAAAAITVGEIYNVSGLSSPSNDINIGTFEDTEIVTRPGRRKMGSLTFDLMLNPDMASQIAIKACENTGEEIEVKLIYPEGTIRTRTFKALVSQFGDDAADDDVYKGHITLEVTSNEVRT